MTSGVDGWRKYMDLKAQCDKTQQGRAEDQYQEHQREVEEERESQGSPEIMEGQEELLDQEKGGKTRVDTGTTKDQGSLVVQ